MSNIENGTLTIRRRKYDKPNALFNVEVEYEIEIRRFSSIMCDFVNNGKINKNTKRTLVCNLLTIRSIFSSMIEKARGANTLATCPL